VREVLAEDPKRRKEMRISEGILFVTKSTIALQQIRKAVEEQVTPVPVLADAACGNDGRFREGLTELLLAVVSVQGTTTVWRPGEGPPVREAVEGAGTPTEKRVWYSSSTFAWQ
jgi:SRSO17 transposase